MLLSNDAIYLNQTLTSQAAVFDFLAKQAVTLGVATDAGAVLASLQERESLGTTGMMDGFAIPHAKDVSIKEAKVLILKLTSGIDWKSMDSQAIDFIFCLMIPDSQAGTTHLKVLSQLARLLMRQPVKQALKEAPSPQAILHVLAQELES